MAVKGTDCSDMVLDSLVIINKFSIFEYKIDFFARRVDKVEDSIHTSEHKE